jgi:hypothetical protein
MYAGQKVPVQRPRVRKRASSGGIEQHSYGAFWQDTRLDQAVHDQLLLGISTRNYELSIRAVCQGYGFKKSSASRRFMNACRKALMNYSAGVWMIWGFVFYSSTASSGAKSA